MIWFFHIVFIFHVIILKFLPSFSRYPQTFYSFKLIQTYVCNHKCQKQLKPKKALAELEESFEKISWLVQRHRPKFAIRSHICLWSIFTTNVYGLEDITQFSIIVTSGRKVCWICFIYFRKKWKHKSNFNPVKKFKINDRYFSFWDAGKRMLSWQSGNVTHSSFEDDSEHLKPVIIQEIREAKKCYVSIDHAISLWDDPSSLQSFVSIVLFLPSGVQV